MGAKGVSPRPGETGLHPTGCDRLLEPILLFCRSPLELMLTGVLVLAGLFSIIFFVSGGSHFQDPLFCGESPPRVWGLIPCQGRERRSGIWGEPWDPLRAGSLSRSVCGVLLHLRRRLDHLAGGGWLHFWLHGGLRQRGTTSPCLGLSHVSSPVHPGQARMLLLLPKLLLPQRDRARSSPGSRGVPWGGVWEGACPHPI